MARKPINPNKSVGVEVGTLPQRQTEEYRSIYSNLIEVGSSPWDFHIVFFEVTEDEEGNLIRERKVRVTMSPQHMVAHTKLLNSHLADWMGTHAPGTIDKSGLGTRATHRLDNLHASLAQDEPCHGCFYTILAG